MIWTTDDKDVERAMTGNEKLLGIILFDDN